MSERAGQDPPPMLSDYQLSELERLTSAATPKEYQLPDSIIAYLEFASAARAAVPELLAEVRALRATLTSVATLVGCPGYGREVVDRVDGLVADRDRYRGLVHAETIASMYYCETHELGYMTAAEVGAKCPHCELDAVTAERDRYKAALEDIGEGACRAKYGPGCDGACERVAWRALAEPPSGGA